MRWLKNTDDSTAHAPIPLQEMEILMAPPENIESGEPRNISDLVYPRLSRKAMGSLFEIYLAGEDRESLQSAGEDALDQIERLDNQLSHYNPESDITRMNHHAAESWVRLEPRIYQLLKRCVKISEQTEGAFDISASPLIKLWGFHEGSFRIPDLNEIDDTKERVGSEKILFDDDDNLIHFPVPGMQVMLGAIGKGYAIDEAIETLGYFHVKYAVLHGGQSTIYALGAPPEEEGWPFSITDPRDGMTTLAQVKLKNCALSTSGDYEQFFERNGKRYGHILDPRTGYPVQSVRQVSVIAPDATESDALSTAFFVLGPEKTGEYCAIHPEIRALMVVDATDGIRTHRFGDWAGVQ